MLVHKGVPPFKKGGRVVELEDGETVVRQIIGKTLDFQRETTKQFIAEHPEAKVVEVPKPQKKNRKKAG